MIDGVTRIEFMKFMILVAAAASAGALAILAVPASLVQSGVDSVHALVRSFGVGQLSLADLNPFRAVFDFEQKRISTGETPDQLGFHTSAVTAGPMWTPSQSFSVNVSPGPYGFDPQAQYEIQQNNQRMEDLRNYNRDPMHWTGPPPH
jgi:hypothetical protein